MCNFHIQCVETGNFTDHRGVILQTDKWEHTRRKGSCHWKLHNRLLKLKEGDFTEEIKKQLTHTQREIENNPDNTLEEWRNFKNRAKETLQ
ncbi:hypothetical protein RRG08_013263, partial [Elysia crispata]